eukprot:1161610-Pelagomonas_calceolata.AAC.3
MQHSDATQPPDSVTATHTPDSAAWKHSTTATTVSHAGGLTRAAAAATATAAFCSVMPSVRPCTGGPHSHGVKVLTRIAHAQLGQPQPQQPCAA